MEGRIMEGGFYECETYWARIYISGPIDMIKQCCREFVLTGLCVTVTPTTYIYTHGEEEGAIIELIQYPKYPHSPGDEDVMWDKMIDLANFVLDNTHQGSYTVVDPTHSVTFDRRKVYALPPED